MTDQPDLRTREVYVVTYYAGPYGGRRRVEAVDAEEAVAKVRAQIRRTMTLPMYADGYRAVVDGAE